MRKFKIPKTPTATNKSIRFPDETIVRVEKVLMGTTCSFSAFVVAAVHAVLEEMEDEKKM